MFGKNPFLELSSKNLKVDQNRGFFKLEFLTNKLRYEVEFLDVTRGSTKATNINWLLKVGVVRHAPTCSNENK